VPKIPDEIITQIIEQWLDIQEIMVRADQLWRKNPRQAALALAYGWGSFAQASARIREAMGEPNVAAPTDAASHLTAALCDLYAGKVDPMLALTPEEKEGRGAGRPGVALSTALQRIYPPVAMVLLMARDPKVTPERAAEEMSAKLGGDPRPATLLHWWRHLDEGGETEDVEIFRALVEQAKREVAARGLDADAYLPLVEAMAVGERGRSFR
jgi:hypothetical protein